MRWGTSGWALDTPQAVGVQDGSVHDYSEDAFKGVNLAMAAGGWWVENRERPPTPLRTASRGWGVNCAEAPCGQKY